MDNDRKNKGMQIAKTCQIIKSDEGWTVPSQSGKGLYHVSKNAQSCDCPDFSMRHSKCKHVWAVEIILTHEIDNEGNERMTKTVKVTYSQDWQAYDESQKKQKLMFMALLSDLTQSITNDEYKFGRPRVPKSDLLFASALKVFTTFSLRRFMSDIEIAKERNYIEEKPCYASIGHFMQREDITPLLKTLVKQSSLPLKSIETTFAIDSSGFSTCRFDRWFSIKHGKDVSHRKFLKAHISIGTKTNVITAIEITDKFGADNPQFKTLLNQTAENFSIGEVVADKAYSSRDNLSMVEDLGGMPYIPFRKNTTDRAKGILIWKKMWHFFQLNREEFMERYHQRSNVETAFHMIKSKFGDSLRSKSLSAQTNEVLLKALCHNICCLIQEVHELGIQADFQK